MRPILALLCLFMCWAGLTRAASVGSGCPSGPLFAETFPIGAPIDGPLDIATHVALISLLNNSVTAVDMAFYYFSLTDGDDALGGQYGLQVFDAIVAAAKRGVKIRIAVDGITDFNTQADVLTLVSIGAADALFMNFTALGEDGGVLHTKFMIADGKAAFIGSANMDWMSFSQTQELSLYFPNCPDIIGDLQTQFNIYWSIAASAAVPVPWPASFTPQYNNSAQGSTVMNGSHAQFYYSTSPALIRPPGWTPDEDAIVSAIVTAVGTVNITMMDYVPAQMYITPNLYWNTIDNAIRAANFNNNTGVNLLIGFRDGSFPNQWPYLMGLSVLPNVQVRYCLIPPSAQYPNHTRLAHGKYFVTHDTFWTSSSNWVGDYFTNTAGVSINILNNGPVLARARAIFERDWTASYTIPLPYPNPSPPALDPASSRSIHSVQPAHAIGAREGLRRELV